MSKVSDDGLINDIQDRIIAICTEGFEDNQKLKHLEHPREFDTVNPNEIEIQQLPSLYAWCSGFGVKRKSAGGMKGNQSLSRRFEFYCNIEYIMPKIENKAASRELRRVAWWLFELVDGNLDLDGFVRGDPDIQELDLFPRLKKVGDSMRVVSNVNMKVIYPFVDKSEISRKSKKYI